VGKAKAMKGFLDWMVTPEAQGMASQLVYAPLPKEVVELIKDRLKTLKGGGKTLAGA
jgi:ABC-type sulfate transport system substrate-binding protein